MIRIIAKLFAVAVALTACLHVAPVSAAAVTYISSTGSDANPCTAVAPCSTFNEAFIHTDSGGQINCINAPSADAQSGIATSAFVTLDCAGVYALTTANSAAFLLNGSNQVVKIRNLTISGAAGGYPAIKVTGSGTLIIENCVFENLAGIALDIEPSAPLTLVIKNSRTSNSAGGVLIKPAGGGSVAATFDGVTIVNNGGGLKTDSTNGLVKVDVSNSTISNNTANGMNIIGGAGGTNVVNLSRGVIASNGQAGIEVSGGNAAVFVDTTLLDENASGATSVPTSGVVYTYKNNRIIGSPGSGFTNSTTLQ